MKCKLIYKYNNRNINACAEKQIIYCANCKYIKISTNSSINITVVKKIMTEVLTWKLPNRTTTNMCI